MAATVAGGSAVVMLVVGVRTKEECSSVIGSVETDGRIVSPCDAITALLVVVAVLLLALAAVAAIRLPAPRVVVALVGCVVTTAAAIGVIAAAGLL